MICPNCKKESGGAKWCPHCGLQLEIDSDQISPFSKTEFGDTQKIRPVSDSAEFNETKPIYTKKKTATGKKKKDGINPTVLICIITSLVLVVVSLFISGAIGKKEEENPGAEDVVLEQEDTDTLMEKGMDNLKNAEYDEAETVFKAVLETDPENDEAETLHTIVYNYNRALKKLQSKKFEEARELFDEIPIEYIDYSIRTDVESLDDEILSYETAYKTFENVQNFMKNEKYEDALTESELIDTKYLDDSDVSLLEEYISQIKQYLESENSKDTDEMSFKKAEIILVEYIEDLVMAINSRDFSVVESHLAGQLYNDQKKLVQTCIDQGISQGFDSLTVKSITKISDTKWKIDVTEAETLYYADGASEKKSFDWTYTLEYIDSEYLLTKIE